MAHRSTDLVDRVYDTSRPRREEAALLLAIRRPTRQPFGGAWLAVYEEFQNRHPQSRREDLKQGDGRVPLPAFDLRQVAGGDVCVVRQLLLAEATIQAQPP